MKVPAIGFFANVFFCTRHNTCAAPWRCLCLVCLEPCGYCLWVCLFPPGDPFGDGVGPDDRICHWRGHAWHFVGAVFLSLCAVAGAAWRHARGIWHPHAAVIGAGAGGRRFVYVWYGRQSRDGLSRPHPDRHRVQCRVSGIAGAGIKMVSDTPVCLSGRVVDVHCHDKRHGGAGTSGLFHRSAWLAQQPDGTWRCRFCAGRAGVPVCAQCAASKCQP